MRYGMVLDLSRCFGCKACTVACKSGNGLPDGIWWNRVLTDGAESEDSATGVFPDLSVSYTPRACQHCKSPACVSVCPVGATYLDEVSGLVVIDSGVCIGCQLCIAACPYDARVYLEEEPTYYQGFQTGYFDAPIHVAQTVEKCTFCYNRLDKGLEPACMHLCPARARHYGDLDDSESEVSKLIKERNGFRLLEDQGTDPSVYFIK